MAPLTLTGSVRSIAWQAIIYLYREAPKKYDLSFLSKHNKQLNETKEINLSPLIQRRLLKKKKLSSPAKQNYGRLALKFFQHLPALKYALGAGVLFYGFIKIQKMVDDGRTYVANILKFSWIPKPDLGQIKSGVTSYIPAKETIYGWGTSIVSFTKAWVPRPDMGKIINAVSSYIPKKETIYDTTKVVTSGVMSGVSWTYSKVRSLFGGKKEE